MFDDTRSSLSGAPGSSVLTDDSTATDGFAIAGLAVSAVWLVVAVAAGIVHLVSLEPTAPEPAATVVPTDLKIQGTVFHSPPANVSTTGTTTCT